MSSLLVVYLKRNTDHLHNTASADLLKRVLMVLIAQGASEPQDDFTRIFATRVLDKAIPPEAALRFADMHGLRLLQGAAYYTILFSATNENGDRKFEPQKFEVGNADARLQQRLLHGYWSMMQYSQLLVDTPPLSVEKCQALKIGKWCRYYNSKYRPTLSHPLAMLEECKQGLVGAIEAYGPGVDRGLVVREIDYVIQQFRDRLMDHFDPSN
jgi:hypothetical protein